MSGRTEQTDQVINLNSAIEECAYDHFKWYPDHLG